MMKKPKFVEALRRFNDLPTNNELETYIEGKVLEPITPSKEMIKEFTEHQEDKFKVTYDETIKNYYNIK